MSFCGARLRNEIGILYMLFSNSEIIILQKKTIVKFIHSQCSGIHSRDNILIENI